MSRNGVLSAAFAMLLLFFTTHTEAVASIVYDFPSQVGLSGDWSLDGGSITTDGTIGEIGPQNFIEWSIRFSSPLGQYEISSDNGAALLVTEYFISVGNYGFSGPIVRPSLRATPDQIIASLGNGYGILELFFTSEDILSPTFAGQAVSFSPIRGDLLLLNPGLNDGTGAIFGLIDNNIDAANPRRPFGPIDPEIFPTNPVSYPNPNISSVRAPSGPNILASVRSVPEPTASLFLLMPCVVMGGIRLRNPE